MALDLPNTVGMDTAVHHDWTLRDAETWAALGAGAVLFAAGLRRGSVVGLGLAAAATPLLYRGITGAWPTGPGDDTRSALGGARGLHVREAVEVDLPVADVYRFWRQLDNLPRFMDRLESVEEDASTGRSRWVARGPGGLPVVWEAEIINDIADDVLAWKSLPGSDLISAGAVLFKPLRGGRSTHVDVHLQYAAPGGRAGAFLAAWLGHEPTQVVRDDLRRLKQILETGASTRSQAARAESLMDRTPGLA